MGKLTLAAGIISHALAVAQQLEFVAEQAIQPDRAAGVEFAGADPHFGTEAKAEAITEAGRAIPEHAGRIDQGHKGFGGCFGGGQWRLRRTSEPRVSGSPAFAAKSAWAKSAAPVMTIAVVSIIAADRPSARSAMPKKIYGCKAI